MEGFWAILCGFLLIRRWWRSGGSEEPEVEVQPTTISSLDKKPSKKATEAEKLEKEIEKRKEKDIEDLRRQGYTDELIAVILPTLYNDGQ